MVLMLAYVGLLALTWSQVHVTTNLALKVALALSPTVPMCAGGTAGRCAAPRLLAFVAPNMVVRPA